MHASEKATVISLISKYCVCAIEPQVNKLFLVPMRDFPIDLVHPKVSKRTRMWDLSKLSG